MKALACDRCLRAMVWNHQADILPVDWFRLTTFHPCGTAETRDLCSRQCLDQEAEQRGQRPVNGAMTWGGDAPPGGGG